MARKSKAKKPKPVREFKIWPERIDRRSFTGIIPDPNLFYRVQIWNTVGDLQKGTQVQAIAMCQPYDRVINYGDGEGENTHCLGVLHFPLESLRLPRVVSHECGHAAFHWARRRGLKNLTIHAVEEDTLDTLGNLTEQVFQATQDLTKN